MDHTDGQARSITVDTRGNSTNIGYILIFVLVLGIASGSFAFLNILSGADNPAGYNADINANINPNGSVDLTYDGPGDDDDGIIKIIADNGKQTTLRPPGNGGGGAGNGSEETDLCDAIGEFQTATVVYEDDETGDSAVVDRVEFDEPQCDGGEPDPEASGDGNVSIAIG